MHDDDPSGEEESWEARESGPVPLPPRRRRERFSEVTTRHRDVGESVHLDPVSSAELARVCSELAQATRADMDEEDVLDIYLSKLAQVFDARRIAVRLLRPGADVLDMVRSTGPMIAGRTEIIRISRDGLRRAGQTERFAVRAGVEVVDTYEPDFEGGGMGFDIVMLDAGQLIGVFAVEYPLGASLPEGEWALASLAALQLGMAVGRARLRREATYLSGYLARLLEHANVPIVVLDRRRQVSVVSQAMLDLTGLSRADLVGRDLVHFVPPEERQRLLPAILAALRGHAMSDFELKLLRHDGNIARLSINLVSILSPQGEVEGVIAIARDLTEVRDLEEQIAQAEKLATLGQLAAGIVHELNNPLTSISVYGEYLRDKGRLEHAPAADVEKLDRIVEASARILRFTRDLVTYARPATEPPRRLSVHDVIEQAVVFCEHTLNEVGAEAHVETDSNLPPIIGVRAQLHQVFINLVTNACHAMPRGAGTLTVRASHDGEMVRVRVSDNGRGIPDASRDRVFEPFFSTKGEGKGTGLGLSIVRNIIQQHGGEITLVSRLGQGTTFEVALPIAGGASATDGDE